MPGQDTPTGRSWLRRPVLAYLMADRRLAVFTMLLGAAQVGLTLAGLPGIQCPVPRLTPSHCPGCGLTRSMEALLRGDWHESLRLHAFGPVVLLGLLLVGVAAIGPARVRRGATRIVRRVETTTGLGAIVLLAIIAYWLIRLVAGHGRVESIS